LQTQALVLKNKTSNNAVLTIDTSAFANGMYSVLYSNSDMQAQKLVIQH
jgi:hypothetical protein